jgi:hypothetical protein
VTCWGGLTHERPSRRPARSYRRSALLLVAGEAGAAKAQELDGKLIALCREFEDAEVTFAAWDAERDSCRSTIRAKEIDTLERALVNRRHEIREEVAELKAHARGTAGEGQDGDDRARGSKAIPTRSSSTTSISRRSLSLVTSWGGVSRR